MSLSQSMGVGVIVLAILGTELAAQWPSEVAPGTRIQIRLPEAQYQLDGPRGHFLRGRVTGLSGDTLYLAVTDSVGSLAIPRPIIQRIDVSRGSPSRGASALRRGALSGVLGAVSGLLTAWAYDESGDIDTGEAALIGGGFGLALGATFGAIFPHERWRHVRAHQAP